MKYNLVDIHFHTDDSFDAYNTNNFDIEELIKNEKKSDTRVDMIVKTDHNILNYPNYKTIKEKLKDININFLPGIEINGDENVHWIFIFNDKQLSKNDSASGKVIGEILDDLIREFYGYSNGYNAVESKKFQNTPMCIYDFITKLSDKKIEYLAIPHLDKTSGAYQKIKSDEEYFKAISNMLLDNIINGFESKLQNEFFKKNIDETIKNIKKAEENIDSNDSNGLIRRKKHLEKMQKLYNISNNSDISIIYGSDFHGEDGIDKYESRKKDLFYMRSLNTFNGLKFALLDCDSRVFSSASYDKYKKTDTDVISKIWLKVNGDNVSLDLGDSLNSIIGARGSGKSFLLNLLCNNVAKINDDNHISKQVSLNYIEYSSGQKLNELKPHSFEYITQKNSTFTKDDSKNSIYEMLAEAPYNINKFKSNIINMSSTKKETIDNITAFFNNLNLLIDLWYKSCELKKESLDYEFLKMYNVDASTLSQNSKMKEIFNGFNKFLEDRIKSKDESYNLVDNAEKDSINLKESLNKILKIKEYDTKYEFEKIVELINDNYHNNLKEIKETIDKNKSSINIVKERALNIITSIDKSLKNIETSYLNNFDELRQYIRSSVYLLKEMKIKGEVLKKQLASALKNEEFIIYETSDQKYSFKTEQVFNIYKLNSEELDSIFFNYNGHIDNSLFLELINQDDYNEELFEAKFYTRISGKTKKHDLNIPKLTESIYKMNDEGNYENLNNMSPGERADILMSMVLKDNLNKILIIDQPEDDLDNETIQEKIVSKIRKLKLKRQIIVVTHNANICINGDSDNIIVCQNDDTNYKYFSDHMESDNKYNYCSINSKLENKQFLDIVCQILDGGKNALRKRVKKVGYQNLFFKEEKDE